MSGESRTEISPRENLLRAIEYRHPKWIPMAVETFSSAFSKYGERLNELVREYPLVFPAGPANLDEIAEKEQENQSYVDDWSCEWLSVQPGILGQVVGHPFANGWKEFEDIPIPDPEVQIDWTAENEYVEKCGREDEISYGGAGSIYQGGFFDRLQFLRGLENLLCDMAVGSPDFERALERVLDYNVRAVTRCIANRPDIIPFHGDIGSQNGLMFSPELFRKYIKPGYKRLFGMCRDAGIHVWYSSDGNLLEIVDDLIDCGVSFHDPQLRPNTLEGIAQAYLGKMCAMVDLDQQMLPFCKPSDIENQMRDVMDTMFLESGGLMLFTSVGADVPFKNIEALCNGWTKYCSPTGSYLQ